MEKYLLKIMIIRKKKQTKGGVTFYTYSSPMFLCDEKNKETPVKHYVDVKFDKSLDSKKKDIKGVGYIYAYSDDIIAPEYYSVKDKFDKNGVLIEGKKEYPHIFIKNFDRFEAKKRVVKQSSFVVEEDTEETQID